MGLRQGARRGPAVLGVLVALLASFLVPGRAEAATGVTFVGASHSAPQAQRAKEVVVPAGTLAGDTMLLVLTRATSVRWTGPTGLSGWTTVATTGTASVTSTVYRRTAGGGEAGARVRFDATTYAKAVLTLGVWRGVAADGTVTAVGSVETSASPSHPAPSVQAGGGETAVSYWADRSSTTTGWDGPASATTRDAAIGTGGGRFSALLVDHADVPSGPLAGASATSTPATTALAWTLLLPPGDGGPGDGTPTDRLLLGAASSSWPWFDAAVGPVDMYREFDSGFGYARWQDTPAHRAHPGARFEYSFRVLPQRLSTPSDPVVEQVRAFVATTPKDIVLTVYHEPENYGAGLFDAAQYRAGLLALKRIVDEQDAADGGQRMVALVLMNITFKGMWSSTPDDWWPTDARDGGHVDLVSADVYALPHATQTACCPAGYTDGVDWRRPEYLMSFVRDFAARHGTPWSVSELGYLEDVRDPPRKSRALRDAVAYAAANGAHHVNVFDSKGDRADWRLRWGSPVGTASSTSTATLTWRDLVAQARAG
ncbi:hypothetical protein LG324_13395 [Phycicoccus jejuensis]|uniref:hypothetical protein n=1 Tax=Phycicoccus jejuensis TaxID=367299 RepID=UPI00384F6208